MPDDISVLVDRIVDGARIPGRARRDSLRRELLTHFEEAGASPDELAEALSRFGSEAMLIDAWRSVYRWDYLLWYAAKVVLSLLASVAVAVVIQLLANLRLGLTADLWRLAPAFPYAAAMSAGLVIGLVTARELARPPFTHTRAAGAILLYAIVCTLARLAAAWALPMLISLTVLVALGYGCSKLRSRSAMVLLSAGAFAIAEYVIHATASIAFAPSRAMATGAVLASILACTLLILGRLDDLFVNRFGFTDRRTA